MKKFIPDQVPAQGNASDGKIKESDVIFGSTPDQIGAGVARKKQDTESMASILLKMAQHGAYDADGRIIDSDGQVIPDSNAAKLASYACHPEPQLRGLSQFCKRLSQLGITNIPNGNIMLLAEMLGNIPTPTVQPSDRTRLPLDASQIPLPEDSDDDMQMERREKRKRVQKKAEAPKKRKLKWISY